MTEPVSPMPRSQCLKEATRQAHGRLDQRIMAAQPFADLARYGRFLQVQYCFHLDMQGYFSSQVLAALVPELAARGRLPQLRADLADLGMMPPQVQPLAAAHDDPATGLGWLYVAEGSNLGAAILLKQAAGLQLDENFGARHLAGHPDGRARHWRQFTAALDGAALSPGQEPVLVEAARQAFDRVRAHVERYLPAAGQ